MVGSSHSFQWEKLPLISMEVRESHTTRKRIPFRTLKKNRLYPPRRNTINRSDFMQYSFDRLEAVESMLTYSEGLR